MTEAQLSELAEYETSAAFDAPERAALRLADAMTATPVEVPEALFAELQRHFDHPQLIELCAVIANENFRARFNHALGIEAQGFSEGATCPLPVRPGGPALAAGPSDGTR